MRSILSRDVLKFMRKKRRKEVMQTVSPETGIRNKTEHTKAGLDETESFMGTCPSSLPVEMLMQILIRLPAKSLVRFKCVSKPWLSLISSRYFSNLFLKPSRFFAYLADQDNPGNYAWFTSSSVSVINQDLTFPEMKGYFLSASRGLVCSRSGTTPQICNIHTRQLVELPAIRSQLIVKTDNLRSYIGYNPVYDEYKVLSVAWKVSGFRVKRSEHQVLVLGAGASWRNIQCQVEHRPSMIGITIDGVLYYGGSTNIEICVLVSFDLTSEEFHLTKFPVTRSWHWNLTSTNLMNYQGKVALFNYSNGITMDVWVLEDAKKSQWSDKKTFVLPLSQMNFVGDGENQQLRMGSTSRSGQVWLTKEGRRKKNQPESFCFFIYDLERKEITQRIEMGPLPGSSKWSLSNFWDDTENLMSLET